MGVKAKTKYSSRLKSGDQYSITAGSRQGHSRRRKESGIEKRGIEGNGNEKDIERRQDNGSRSMKLVLLGRKMWDIRASVYSIHRLVGLRMKVYFWDVGPPSRSARRSHDCGQVIGGVHRRPSGR